MSCIPRQLTMIQDCHLVIDLGEGHETKCLNSMEILSYTISIAGQTAEILKLFKKFSSDQHYTLKKAYLKNVVLKGKG